MSHLKEEDMPSAGFETGRTTDGELYVVCRTFSDAVQFASIYGIDHAMGCVQCVGATHGLAVCKLDKADAMATLKRFEGSCNVTFFVLHDQITCWIN